MKKTLFKDSLREIKKTFSRFIAIVAIIAISVAFYTGIKITCPDMKNTADVYYDDTRLMDFRLVSTAGFTKNEVKKLKAFSENGDISGVSPQYSVDAILDAGDINEVVRVHSLVAQKERDGENYINRPLLISGRLPTKSGECVIEKQSILGTDINIGDVLKLKSGEEGKRLKDLKMTDFKVVGVIKSSLYVSKHRGTSKIGTGSISTFIMINESDFDMKYYTSVYITATGSLPFQAYSDEYDKRIEVVQKKLDDIAEVQRKARFDEILADANATLKKKTADYDSGVRKAKTKFADALKKIKDGQNKIYDGQYQLSLKKAEFSRTMAASEAKINDGARQYVAGLASYKKQAAAFSQQKKLAIKNGSYAAQKMFFDKMEIQLKAAVSELSATRAQIIDSRKQLADSAAYAKSQFASSESTLFKAQNDINIAKSDYNKEKNKADKKIADGKKKIEDAKKKIADIPEVKWHVLDRNTNAGYVDYGTASDRMNAIAQVFPLIFIFVGILIIFTTMGRTVDEQRGLIGTFKALGYSKTSIAGKYLLYATLASLIGGSIGVVVGFSFFPSMIYKAFTSLYTLPPLILTFDTIFAALAIAISIAVTVVSALLVCLEELHVSSAQLMRPKAPKPGKKILLEKITFLWKRLKFTQKVTARNLLRYKARFFMTVIGVAGCTALILVGFGLKDSIGDIGARQFGEIYNYQMTVNVKDNVKASELKKIDAIIDANKNFNGRSMFLTKSMTIGFGTATMDCGLVVPQNVKELPKFISLHERVSKKPLLLENSGVILTEKLSTKLGVKVGDSVFIKIDEYTKRSVKVAGITEQYLDHYMYMTNSVYSKIFKEKPVYNDIYVKLLNISTSDEDAFSKQLVSIDGVTGLFSSSELMTRFKETVNSINFVVLVLIFSAALLSFIVLYTLTNINISERMREIATIKVLGFYDLEVASYVFRENIILTFIGSILGLGLGYYLAMFVIQTAEVNIVMFGREIYPLSFLYSSLLTLAFALFVNIVMLRKIRKINMVEALKTVE